MITVLQNRNKAAWFGDKFTKQCVCACLVTSVQQKIIIQGWRGRQANGDFPYTHNQVQ